MNANLNFTIKRHLIRGAFYVLPPLAVCAIPFALAQSRSRDTTKPNVLKPTVLPNLTALSPSISKTHAIRPNPDFVPPGVIERWLRGLRPMRTPV